MRFVDEIEIVVKAGDGGNGAIAFRRERFRPKGGPAGGDGGKGGDVVLRADRNLHTLRDLGYRPRVEASRGRHGGGNDRCGRGGDDAVLRVPPGTTVSDRESGETLGDLVEDGQELVAARGGEGGRGNMRFATPSNRAPRRAEPGAAGEQRSLRLELMLLADVGLVGLPNTGKSTIVSRISAARPKIADYPFTTLVPSLGVVEIGPAESFTVADIPGLVPGAARGAGLGRRFLRHVRRSAILLYVLAPDPSGESDPLADLETLRFEVAEFDPALRERPCLVALNKCDLPEALELADGLGRELEKRDERLLICSAASGEGLDRLVKSMAELMAERRAG